MALLFRAISLSLNACMVFGAGCVHSRLQAVACAATTLPREPIYNYIEYKDKTNACCRKWYESIGDDEAL